jgi:cell division initiation protein
VALTPEEIESKEFVVVLRGYDPADVHAFLRQVAGDYRDVCRQLEATGAGGGGSGAAAHIDGLIERLNTVLRTATDEAGEILADAERQAAQIRDGARREAGLPTESGDSSQGAGEPPDVLRRARATVRQAVDRYRH